MTSPAVGEHGQPPAIDFDALTVPDPQPAALPPADAQGPGGGAGTSPRASRARGRQEGRQRRTSRPADQTSQATQATQPSQGTPPQYETMAAWVKGWFHPVIERQTSTSLVWCPHWWRHPEAIAILDALWTSWEGARADQDDPHALLVWWERAVVMMSHLTSPHEGPFAACSPTAHQVEDTDLALPYQPEPPGFFGVILDTGPTGYPGRGSRQYPGTTPTGP